MFIGIDLGTSSIKTILIDENQKTLGFASESIELLTPKAGFYEQNPEAWFNATLRCFEKLKNEFPKQYKPTTIIFTKNLNVDKKIYKKGVKIITIPDLRWLRRDIKTTSLLPNVLSKQIAIEKNAFESWLIDNGNITEGSASNAWIIKSSNTIITHPANTKILKGVTRDTIIKILKKNNFNVIEKPFNLIEAKNAKEAFLTSSTLSILPVVKIDNYNISNGKPGDITKKIMYLYNNYINKNNNSLTKELKIA